jgi:hypothetical protein
MHQAPSQKADSVHNLGSTEAAMGYQSKVQVIERGGIQRQFYSICSAPLAQALEIEKAETIEWIVQDMWTPTVRRLAGAPAKGKREGAHGKG